MHDVTVTTRPDNVVEVLCATCQYKPRVFEPERLEVEPRSLSRTATKPIVYRTRLHEATIYAIAHTLGINFARID